MLNPHELAEKRIQLSEAFSRYSGELAKLIKTQADFFNTNRESYKSDTACQRAFESSLEGVQMTVVKLKLKSLEKEMSAIKTMLEVLTEEARGLY